MATITGTDGPDTLTGTADADTIDGLGGDDTLNGGSGDDTLDGGPGNDSLHGGIGHDTLIGGPGDDLFDGGINYDTASFADATQGVTVDVTNPNPQDTGEGLDTFVSIENVTGSAYDDVLSAPVSLDGGAGDDRLYVVGDIQTPHQLLGGDGNDLLVVGANGPSHLDGGPGNDRMYGGPYNDTYVVDTQNDLVFEQPNGGVDTITSSVSFYLYANVESLTLDASAGDAYGVGSNVYGHIQGNDGNNLLIAGSAGDSIHGGGGNDSIYGDGSLYGDAGTDYIDGGSGDDYLDGGDGPDALYGEAGNDALWGGNTFDTDILVGGDGNDILHGDSGLGDYDRMDGGAGNDTYYVDTGDDLTFEAAGGGTDTVYANVAGTNNGVYLYPNVENLVLTETTAFGVGNGLDNYIRGDGVANWLLGGDGNDTIDGGPGNDVLFGQSGDDTFVFEQSTGGDVIGDFTHGEDKINVHAFGFASFADLQRNFIQVGDEGGIYLNPDHSDFIVLQHTDMSTLDAGDFIL